MDPERVRAEWDAAADGFDLEPDHGMLEPETRAAWWNVLSTALPAPPARVADLGCGTGTVATLLADNGYEVTGLDLSPRMIELARAKTRSAGHSVMLSVGDAAEPRLPAGSVDAVFARHVVWALPDPEAALRRWSDLLVPGGRFVLVEGRWSTGGGLPAATLRALVEPVMRHVDVVPLSEAALWGRQIDDERYLLLARN